MAGVELEGQREVQALLDIPRELRSFSSQAAAFIWCVCVCVCRCEYKERQWSGRETAGEAEGKVGSSHVF